jgi:hypothetical protein
MLKQQQQQMQLQQVLRQQQLEQEMQWLEQQTAAEFDRGLQDELIQQLEAAGSAQQQQQQQSGADPLQLTTTSSMGATPGAAAAATTAGGLMEQQQVPGLSIGVQPSQLASWPLPIASRQASMPAAATAVAAAGATHVGLLLHGLSDAALPLSQGPRRLSLDAGGLVRKRDKMLMGLLAVKDEGPTGGRGPEWWGALLHTRMEKLGISCWYGGGLGVHRGSCCARLGGTMAMECAPIPWASHDCLSGVGLYVTPCFSLALYGPYIDGMPHLLRSCTSSCQAVHRYVPDTSQSSASCYTPCTE